MLCKSQNQSEKCLLEGRRVTRCAADLYVFVRLCINLSKLTRDNRLGYVRLEKMRASCAKEFESHWQCLEHNNQVCSTEEVVTKYVSLMITYSTGILPMSEARTTAKCMHVHQICKSLLFNSQDGMLNSLTGPQKDDTGCTKRCNANT
jgi:hypothetical protein